MTRSHTVLALFATAALVVLSGCATTSPFVFDVTDPANDASAVSPEVTRMFGFVDGSDFVLAVTFDADVVEDDVVGLVAIDSDGDPSTFAFTAEQTAPGAFCDATNTADYSLEFDTIDGVTTLFDAFEPFGVAQPSGVDLDPPTWETVLGARRLVVRIPTSYGLGASTDAEAVFGNTTQPTDCVPGGGASL